MENWDFYRLEEEQELAALMDEQWCDECNMLTETFRRSDPNLAENFLNDLVLFT